MNANFLINNLAQIKNRIKSATAQASLPSEFPEILAVSKYQPIEKIQELSALGQVWFGENYSQELISKAADPRLAAVKWQFIGTLQSNKISKLVQYADMISSISSIKHARLIDTHTSNMNRSNYPVAILVNTASEASKSGVSWAELAELVDFCRNKTTLDLRGIMAIPPKDDRDLGGLTRLDFYRLIIKRAHDLGLGFVSLGMSDDLELAVQAGSNQLRIGTALFGERPKIKK